jgi:hypothetical protein
MRIILVLTLAIAAALPVRADLAPEPTDPSTPEGAVVWISIIAAVAALALIWFRRRR